MVLLTSSSISVAVSSGVIFVFTFLLFLSGYVVQQQTVRSLQAALHPPPTPTPTLPSLFQEGYDSAQTGTASSTGSAGTAEAASNQTNLLGFQTRIKSDPEPSALPHSEDHIQVQSTAQAEPVSEATAAGQDMIQNNIADSRTDVAEEILVPFVSSDPKPTSKSFARLAYAQLLSTPSQICSALLFFKLHTDYGDADISRLIIYPSFWEDDTSSDAFANVLSLMRLVKDDFKIVYRPISVNDLPEERDIEGELAAHLATEDWEFDRMMYLRSPGLALDVAALDSALQASSIKAALSRDWARMTLKPSRAPSILLIADHGMHTPRGSNRRLTAEAFTSHANQHENEMEVEAAAETAAYVHFEEGELEHRRTEKEWHGGVFERYERERAEICKGIIFDEGRIDLRRARKRGWR